MSDVVNLPISLDSDLGRELTVDLARYRENILTEQQVRKKFRFDDATWESLGSDDALIRKVEEESIRRIRDGSSKREKSQKLVVAAPDILSGILLDSTANAKHRIDSAKTLNDFAANGPTAAPTADRFIISINLSADAPGDAPTILNFNKSIAIDANDGDGDSYSYGDDVDDPHGLIAAFSVNKSKGGGSGQGHL